jgi:hypothetical protein
MTVNGELEGIRKGMAGALFLVRLFERTEENHQKTPNQNSLCPRHNLSTTPPATIQKRLLKPGVQKFSRNLRSLQKVTGARGVASNSSVLRAHKC